MQFYLLENSSHDAARSHFTELRQVYSFQKQHGQVHELHDAPHARWERIHAEQSKLHKIIRQQRFVNRMDTANIIRHQRFINRMGPAKINRQQRFINRMGSAQTIRHIRLSDNPGKRGLYYT